MFVLFFPSLLIHSIGLDSSEEHNIAHTLGTEKEGGQEREKERTRGGQTNTHTRRSNNSDTVQEFSQND